MECLAVSVVDEELSTVKELLADLDPAIVLGLSRDTTTEAEPSWSGLIRRPAV
jgi:hypothetical protein